MTPVPVAHAIERPAAVATLVALAVLPFCLVDLPPLVDAPGHLAQLVVQAMAPDSPLRGYFDFHWAFRLNLGTDLLVEVLRHPLGIERAFLFVTALIPATTVLGVLLMARYANRGDAAAAAWALPFAYSFPFSFGFLNYMLGMALAFCAFACWCALDARPRRREAFFWLILPLLLTCHAVGGGLLPVMIVARELGAGRPRRLAVLRPLLAILPPLLLWKLGTPAGQTPTVYYPGDKINAVVFALRDQLRWLDLASVAATVAVPLAGLGFGARYARRDGAIVLILLLLFVAMPSEFGGATFTDTRLVPAIAVAALTLQDWSRVPRRIAMWAMIAGLAVFAARIAVTAAGFARYRALYAAEQAALPHIGRGARVLALVTHRCRPSRTWRMDRLDHLPALATVAREAWVNVHWEVGAVHLMHIRFAPSPEFRADPSHYVWPNECVGTRDPTERNPRRTIAEVMPALPLGAVDYLWLVDARLPAGARSAELSPVWSNGNSTLYRTIHPSSTAQEAARRRPAQPARSAVVGPSVCGPGRTAFSPDRGPGSFSEQARSLCALPSAGPPRRGGA